MTISSYFILDKHYATQIQCNTNKVKLLELFIPRIFHFSDFNFLVFTFQYYSSGPHLHKDSNIKLTFLLLEATISGYIYVLFFKLTEKTKENFKKLF